MEIFSALYSKLNHGASYKGPSVKKFETLLKQTYLSWGGERRKGEEGHSLRFVRTMELLKVSDDESQL